MRLSNTRSNSDLGVGAFVTLTYPLALSDTAGYETLQPPRIPGRRNHASRPFSPRPHFPIPTPLEPMESLTQHLGGPEIWIKRDDCTGLATGGNKTRKLEYLMGEARRRAPTTS